MSEDNQREDVDMTSTNASSEDLNSPTGSSPIDIRSKRRKARDDGQHYGDTGPTLLPFSGDENIHNRPDTAVEKNVSDASEEPIIRGHKETEELQVRLFQLKMEIKTIQDELRRRIPGFEDDAAYTDHDKTHSFLQDDVATQATQNLDRRNSSSPPVSKQCSAAHASLAESAIAELKTANNGLMAENSQLRDQINDLVSQSVQSQSQDNRWRAEITKLRQSIAERDANLQRLRESQEFQSRALIAERSRSNLLHESKKNLTMEIDRLKEELRLAREISSTSVSGSGQRETPTSKASASQDLSHDIHLKKMEAELEQVILQKNQIGDMLIDERALTSELQRALEELDTEATSREQALNANLDSLNAELTDLRTQRNILTRENDDLKKKADALDLSLSNLRDGHKELEKRIEQQLEEQQELKNSLVLKERRLNEKSKLLTERQEKLGQLGTELENRNSEIANLNLRLKHLTVAYEASQSDLNETRDNVENRDSRLKKLKNDLKEKRKEHDATIEELQHTKTSLATLEERTQNEISTLRSDLKSALRKSDDLKEEYQASINDITRAHNLEMSQQSKDSKSKIAELQGTVSSHLLKIADMKRDVFEANNRIQQLTSETKSNSVTIESQARKILELESNLGKQESELFETVNRLREASEALKAKSFELKNKVNVEEALTSKVQKLEKTVSDQSVQLNNLSNVNIAELQQKSQENAKAADELAQLRREYNSSYAQWVTYHDNAERYMQELLESKKSLESQIQALRSSEEEREFKLRESVRASHESQMKYLRDDCTYNFNTLQNAYESISNDLTLARNEKDAALNSLRVAGSNLELASAEVDRLKTEIQRFEKMQTQMSEQLAQVAEEKTSLNDELLKLNSVLEDSKKDLDSRSHEVSELRAKLDEAQAVVKARQFELEDSAQEIAKMRNYYSNMSLHANHLMSYAWHEIANLQFIKSVYMRVFPRLDLVPNATRKPRTSLQGLQRAIYVVLALVKFKNAGRLGIKRQCYFSEEFFRDHYTD